jgi:putative ABC transport system substrate-binding protein
MQSLRQGLGELGFVEGRNVAIEYRWDDGSSDRLPEIATELVRRRVAVIVAMAGGGAELAAKAATTTIPILFGSGLDPVAADVVASFNRPGGNLTGVTTLTVELVPKRLELLHEVVPKAATIAVLLNRGPSGTPPTELQDAAHLLGLRLQSVNLSPDRDLGRAFGELAQMRAGALMIPPDPYSGSARPARRVDSTARNPSRSLVS